MKLCKELKYRIEKECRKAIDIAILKAREAAGSEGDDSAYRMGSMIYNDIRKRIRNIEAKIKREVQKELERVTKTMIESAAHLSIENDDPSKLKKVLEQLYSAFEFHLNKDINNRFKYVLYKLEEIEENAADVVNRLFRSYYLNGDVVQGLYEFLESGEKVFKDGSKTRFDVIKTVELMAGSKNFIHPKLPDFYRRLDSICDAIETIENEILYNPEEGKYTRVSYTAEDVNKDMTYPFLWLIEKSVERNHGPLRIKGKGCFITDPKMVRGGEIEIMHEFRFIEPAMIYAVVVKSADPSPYSYARTIKTRYVETIRVRDLGLAIDIANRVYDALKSFGIGEEEMIHHIHPLDEKIKGEEYSSAIEATGLDEEVRKMLLSKGINLDSKRKKKGEQKAREILKASEYLIQVRKLGVPSYDAADRTFGEKSKFIPYVLKELDYRHDENGLIEV